MYDRVSHNPGLPYLVTASQWIVEVHSFLSYDNPLSCLFGTFSCGAPVRAEMEAAG